MWELDYKESLALKNWCFWTVVLQKTLESPLDCNEIKPINPKSNQSWIFIERTDVEAEAPILWPPDSLEKTLMLGKTEGRRKGWQRIRIRLPKQRTHVQSLVWKDSTCRGAAKPEPRNYWALLPQLLEPECPEPTLSNKRSPCTERPQHQLEKAPVQLQNPSTAKNKSREEIVSERVHCLKRNGSR